MNWNRRSAQDAFEQGHLKEWLLDYLGQPEWKNEALQRRVQQFSVRWLEPQLISLDFFDPIAGPGSEFMFPKNIDEWERDVELIVKRGIDVEEIPPIIGWIKPDSRLNLSDGNHRTEAARRLGIDALWAIVHIQPLTKSDFALYNKENSAV